MTAVDRGPSGAPLQLTNKRSVRDHLRVDIDADGRVYIEIEIGCGEDDDAGDHCLHQFYLDRKALCALRDDLAFYIDPQRAAGG